MLAIAATALGATGCFLGGKDRCGAGLYSLEVTDAADGDTGTDSAAADSGASAFSLVVTVENVEGETEEGNGPVIVAGDGAWHLEAPVHVENPSMCTLPDTITFQCAGEGVPTEPITIDAAGSEGDWGTDEVTLWDGWLVAMEWYTWIS